MKDWVMFLDTQISSQDIILMGKNETNWENVAEESKTVPAMNPQERTAVFVETALPHSDALYRTALRLTRNVRDAEDLVQETFARAFKSFHQFTLGTNIKAWLFKIMTNLNINQYQKESKKPSGISFDDIEDFFLYNRIAESSDPLHQKNVEEEVLSNFLDEEVKSAVEKLPWEFRATVILADVEGFHYQEIADIMDCPIGTVRSRLSRGRKILQKYLWDYARQRDYVKEKSN